MPRDTPTGRLTPWYPSKVRPERVGVYERELEGLDADRRRFAYWDGGTWYGYAQDPAGARNSFYNGFASEFQRGGRWRGLARKPWRSLPLIEEEK